MKYLLFIILSISFSAYAQSSECIVKRIIDGDTFVCIFPIDKEEKIRLIGVDAPESRMNRKTQSDIEKSGMDYETIKALGRQSTEFIKTHIKPADVVKLEIDIQNRDSSGRILAYVYLQDGTMFNQLLVEEGYAQVATYPPNVKYVDLFIAAQKQAQKNKKGLWKD